MIKSEIQDSQNYALSEMKKLRKKSTKTLLKIFYDLYEAKNRNIYAEELMRSLAAELQDRNNGTIPDKRSL